MGTTVANGVFRIASRTLLAVYVLGPQTSIPIPHYDGPTDRHTDTILNPFLQLFIECGLRWRYLTSMDDLRERIARTYTPTAWS